MTRERRAMLATAAGLIALHAVIFLVPPGGTRAEAGQLVGQTPASITYTNTASVSCTGTSGTLVAAATGAPREATLSIPSTADTGVYITFGSTAATSSYFLLSAGQAMTVSGVQAVNCIKANSSNVSVSVLVGTSAGYVP